MPAARWRRAPAWRPPFRRWIRAPLRTMADMGMGDMARHGGMAHGSWRDGAMARPCSHGAMPAMDHGAMPATAMRRRARSGQPMPTASIRDARRPGRRRQCRDDADGPADEPAPASRQRPPRADATPILRAISAGDDPRPPSREIVLHLTGNMERFIWGFDGKKFSEAEPIRLKLGERVRFVLINDTMMEHPIHLHGTVERARERPGRLPAATSTPSTSSRASG